jgi:hypothetical protein
MKSPVNGNTSVSQSTAADVVISPTPLSSAPFSASAGKSRWRSGGGSFSLESHLQSAPPGKHTSHNLVSTAVPQTSGPPINRRRAFSFLSATPANDAYNFHRAGAELEIRFLADACHKARCYAWCILLCTMLADIETVIETLQECSQRDAVKFNWLIDQYRKTIMETGR